MRALCIKIYKPTLSYCFEAGMIYEFIIKENKCEEEYEYKIKIELNFPAHLLIPSTYSDITILLSKNVFEEYFKLVRNINLENLLNK